jgi:hypothetical protein
MWQLVISAASSLKTNVPVISAITALVAVFLGPVISYFIAKKQLFSNVIVVNRIRWVEDLRKDIAEFVSAYANQRILYDDLQDADTNDETKRIRVLLEAATQDISKKRFLLRPKLNPNETQHAKLLELLALSMEQLTSYIEATL